MADEEQPDPIVLPAWRNPIFNARGTIDIEIRVGDAWWPFTASPDDVDERGRLLYDAVSEAGDIAPFVPPTAEETRALLPDLSRKQFRLGMRDLGVTSTMIDAALAAIPDEDAREIAQIEWEESAAFSRLHPLIAQLSAAFGKTDEEIDAAWQSAVTYT